MHSSALAREVLPTVAFASRYPHSLIESVACGSHIVLEKAYETTWDQNIRCAKNHGVEALGKQSVERWLTGKRRDSPEWNWAISMVTAASSEGIESAAKVLYDNDETIEMRRTRLLASMW